MPHQTLQNLKRYTGIQHVHRIGMAERMWRDRDREPRQPGGCKLKTAPVRPVVAARPAEYVCSEDLFY